jgi:chromosome partitioning protein
MTSMTQAAATAALDESAQRDGDALANSQPHRTRIVVFLSLKGGAGKTTLCGQLAVQAERAGAGPVALIDADPQGSLAAWWEERKAEPGSLIRSDGTLLARDIESLRHESKRLVFIDTPSSGMRKRTRVAIGDADLVVVPVRPSPHDLRVLASMLGMISSAEELPLVFVVNGAMLGARLTAQVCAALGRHGMVAPVVVHQRNEFMASMVEGGTVMEARPESTASAEIAELWQFLADRLAQAERPKGQFAEGAGGKLLLIGSPSGTRGFGRRRLRQSPETYSP